ncbi:hypothetical protein BsWGS_17021 [Bradybaena similaris]
MRSESKRRSAQMSSLLATGLPPPRIYRKKEDAPRPALQLPHYPADTSYCKPVLPSSSPAGDCPAVENLVVEPPAPETSHSISDVLLEDAQPPSPPLEETNIIASADPTPVPTPELGSVDDSGDKFPPSTTLPEKLKNMSFVSPFQQKVSHLKNSDKSCVGPPPLQTADEDHSRGMYIPSASSPYPSLEDNNEYSIPDDPSQREELTETYPNPFKSSCSVLRLSGGLFEEFLKQMDVVMVMFYKGSLGQQGSRESWSKEQFVKASERTKRTNHAYAAVDCSKESSICTREAVTSVPLFKLYSKGYTVDTIRNYQSFDSETMQKFVEYAPVVQQRQLTDTLFPEIPRPSAPHRAIT